MSRPGLNHTTRVVLTLVQPVCNMGYDLYTDRFYTSPLLACELANLGITLTGTVKGVCMIVCVYMCRVCVCIYMLCVCMCSLCSDLLSGHAGWCVCMYSLSSDLLSGHAGRCVWIMQAGMCACMYSLSSYLLSCHAGGCICMFLV